MPRLKDKTALIWEGESGDTRTVSYGDLHREVCKFSNVLEELGVKKGDRIAIYMPMMIEACVAMLACARIGAIHSVVFGGFSAKSLKERILDSECKVLITADALERNGKRISLKSTCDEAMEDTPCIKKCIVIPRFSKDCSMNYERDLWYDELMNIASDQHSAVILDAEDSLFILYTSGTTGKPKGVLHTQGGYAVGAHTSFQTVFDAKETDVFWCTADVGWITGHTYVTYGPLLNGMTQVIYEGSPTVPSKNRFWNIIDRHQVSIFYTAPTAIRLFMRWGEKHLENNSLSSLRLLGSVGEPLNPEAWMWYYKHIGKSKCPIVDTWWQTETGSIMICDHPAFNHIKPGYSGHPLPGIKASVFDESGEEITDSSSGGLLGITHPWPSMIRSIWGDHKRYKETYFSKFGDKIYFPGDGAFKDKEGRFMILGRVDDVLNVSGHRIGTMEVESALLEHESVAEAAVVGRKDDLTGESIVAFVTLADHVDIQLDKERHSSILKEHVAKDIGSIAKPRSFIFTNNLPKTRSGKIMRRLLRDLLEGYSDSDTSTLSDVDSFEKLKYDMHNIF